MTLQAITKPGNKPDFRRMAFFIFRFGEFSDPPLLKLLKKLKPPCASKHRRKNYLDTIKSYSKMQFCSVQIALLMPLLALAVPGVITS